jgi:hypothetical protein
MNKFAMLITAAVFTLALSGFAQTEAVAHDAVTPPAAAQVVVADQQDDLLPMATCLMCSSSSTGACKGARQCVGTRKACRKKGCKITGTSSCSTAANVKKC